jgi:hypothetical protein
MKRLKKELLPGVIVTTVFLLLLLMSTMIQSQMSFFSTYKSYYEKSIARVDVNGLQFDPQQFISTIDEALDESSYVVLHFPMYNAQTSMKMIYPAGSIEQLNYFEKAGMLENCFVIGRNSYPSIAKDLDSRQLSIYDELFENIGVLPQSPFDQDILLYSSSILSNTRFQSNITAIAIASGNYESAQQQLKEVMFAIDDSSYMGSVYEEMGGLSQENIAEIFSEYRQLFLQLVVIILLSIGVHYYQRFDLWKTELAVRKMIGAHSFQLVMDTFKKFFFLLSGSFVTALLMYFGIIRLLPWFLPLSLGHRLIAIVHVFALYMSLLCVFFLLSVLYVRKHSVADIFLEVLE